jgi:glyoxylase-like metal-dependent hydrolase (beta-lactamase superfamily II)
MNIIAGNIKKGQSMATIDPTNQPKTNILNVGYDSTNYYLIGKSATRLLIDVGWPGTLPKLQNILKRRRVPLQDIKYLLVTHYHPDHAGLPQEVKLKSVLFLSWRARFPLFLGFAYL